MDIVLPKGSKGSSGSSPTQTPDSLSSVSYAQILDLISEGPIYGPPSGDPAQSVYLNDVPLKNSDGTYNFEVSAFDFRYGEVDQTYIPGFDSAQHDVPVGVALTHAVPWSVVVSDLTQNAIVITLGLMALSQTDTSGNVTGYTVAYQIQMQADSGAWQTVVDTAFSGKCSSAYQRSHRIPLSGATSQYSLRVVRTTADSTSVYVQDKTSVVSYTLVVDAKLRYPLSSLSALSINAVQFSNVPTRSYHMRGLLVSVPSNYNPVTRTYSGVWDGTFVKAWTNNPAWIFYDLVLNSRYGLGSVVDASMVDRYSLYQIAQYCDQLVSDGAGGQEPRFTCNCYIQSRADAYKVLQDLAAIFRGMAYWAAGSVVATCDMPQDPAYLYTAANVVDGTFSYVGASRKNRYTCAVVTWNDPANAYKQAVEYVEDADGIARYGINRAQVTAFGCTSRGQAQRVGQWLLLTSRYETNVVTFSVGLDGTLVAPGQIIAVADPARASVRRGGRVHSAADTAHVTLDKLDPSIAIGDTLTAVLPQSGTAQSRITGINGNTVTLSPPLPATPVPGAVWVCESATLKAQLFRVLSVAEKDGIVFEISAAEYQPGKFAAIDSGARIDVQPITSNTFTTQQPPAGVQCSQYVVTDQGIAKTNLTISWQPAANAVSYRVQFQKDGGSWADVGTTGQTSIDVPNIYAGSYVARVSCTNGAGVTSVFAYSPATRLSGKTTPPPVVASLTASTDKVFAVDAVWSFPADAGDTAYTEVYYSHTNDFSTAVQLGRYSYPTNKASVLGMVAGYDLYFWARLVDTSGNIGAFYPDKSGPGVHGQSSMDATAILAYLTGQITATQLAQELLGPINSIPRMQSDITANASAISSETQARQTADSALATRIDSVYAQFVAPLAGSGTDYAGAATSYAGVWSEQYARASGDGALGYRIDTVQAALDLIDIASLTASIQSEQTARVSADNALASRIDTVQATANSNTASIQTNSTAIAALNGQVSAQYSVKLGITSGGQYYAAGFGLGIDNSQGYVQSQFLVLADRFAILNTANGNTFSPFVIQNGQAYINQALIGNAWITNAMIANAAITSAQIGNAQVTQANIANAAVGSAQIQNAAIANAHIQNAAVGTLTIAGEAVTVPRGSVNGSGSTSSSDTTICSISMPAGIPVVIVQASVVLNAAGTARAYLLRNGVVVSDYHFGTQAASTNATPTLAYFDTSAAAASYMLVVGPETGGGAVTWNGAVLTGLGVKR